MSILISSQILLSLSLAFGVVLTLEQCLLLKRRQRHVQRHKLVLRNVDQQLDIEKLLYVIACFELCQRLVASKVCVAVSRQNTRQKQGTERKFQLNKKIT